MFTEDTKSIFLNKIRHIDQKISTDIESSNIDMYDNDNLNDYMGFKSTLACALLCSNYTDSFNSLKFMTSNDILFDSTILLSLCKSNNDIEYLKYIITDRLNCYIAIGNKHFYSSQMCLSVNPYQYKSIDESIESSSDKIIELLRKCISTLETLNCCLA